MKILLDIGADPNATEHKGRTPLDAACAEFPEEDFRWRLEPTEGTRTRFTDEAYMTLGDQHRPKEKDYLHDMSEHDIIRVSYIIRLLLAHGADISTIVPKSQSFPYNSWRHVPKNDYLDIAVAKRYEGMTDELLQEIEKVEPKEVVDTEENPKSRFRTSNSTFLERYLWMRSHQSQELLDDLVEAGQLNLEIFKLLFRNEDERGVMKLRDLGAELLALTSHGEGTLKVLTKRGYADLLAKIMPKRSDLEVQLNIAPEKAENLSSHTIAPTPPSSSA